MNFFARIIDNLNKGDKSKKEEMYFIDICLFEHQTLPIGFPKTTVLGCSGFIKDSHKRGGRYARTFPGGTFDVKKIALVHV